MNEFQKNWDFAERHMPAVKRILSKHAMRFLKVDVATPEDDMHNGFDLQLSTERGHVAVRVRRADCKYRDLTIRAYLNGNRTELHKLRDGLGDWYLYAWESDAGAITEYALIDIHKARRLFQDGRTVKMNTDGRTGFTSYTLAELQACGALAAYEKT